MAPTDIGRDSRSSDSLKGIVYQQFTKVVLMSNDFFAFTPPTAILSITELQSHTPHTFAAATYTLHALIGLTFSLACCCTKTLIRLRSYFPNITPMISHSIVFFYICWLAF